MLREGGEAESWARTHHGNRDANVAILIDFENARDVSLQRVLAEAAAFGRVIVRRAYADWTRHAKAQNALREAGFEELHQFTSGSGTKNATDIHLTVDAMDILYTRPVDVFMLVTADSDFAKLARRLREGAGRLSPPLQQGRGPPRPQDGTCDPPQLTGSPSG